MHEVDAPTADLALSRRSILKGAAGGLVLGLHLGFGRAAAATDSAGAEGPLIDTWLRIAPSGQVSVLVNCCEMGQGSQTGFAQIVADELDADWATVRVEQAPIDRRYYNVWDIYSTGGSSAIRLHFDKLRKAGAAAREMLVTAAAQRWDVPLGECRAELGRVRHDASGRSAGYGELVDAAARLPVPEKPVLKAPGDWRYIGKPVPRLDIEAKVDGSAIYGVDVRMPGLLVATIAQCPVFGGRLVDVDEAPALAVRGVKRVVRLPDAVAVVATGYWPARKGLEALRPQWDMGALANISSGDLSAGLHKAAAEATLASLPRGTDQIARRRDVAAALRAAPRRVSATYEVQLLSQSPLEPMNGTAWVRADSAELWMPTQVQSQLRADVAKAVGLPEARVTLHTTQIGGGFGRRLSTDYGVQAALISKAVGAPVKLIWSREEDTKHGFYRPAAVGMLDAGLDVDGRPSAYQMRIGSMEAGAAQDIALNFYRTGPTLGLEKQWNPGVRVGSWRAISYTYTVFFMESFIDELAAAARQDPIAYRRSLLADQPRLLRVLDTVEAASGWKRPVPGRHRGVAIAGRITRTYCAQVAEVSLTPANELTVHKITCAIDAGTVVNPDQARAQVEGGIIFALGGALAQEITLANGQVEQATFGDFPVVMMNRMPEIEVILLETPGETLGGFGEPPLPPVAPAICNAIYAATGKRPRRLPLTRSGITIA